MIERVLCICVVTTFGYMILGDRSVGETRAQQTTLVNVVDHGVVCDGAADDSGCGETLTPLPASSPAVRDRR